jgi:predicted metal-dependent phosphoesterase TrpH
MKVELHLHTSPRSGCSTAGPEELLRAAVNLGYEAVYLTEHHDVWPEAELAELQAAVPEIRIFPGVELNLTFDPMQHLLVLGTSDPEYLTIFNPGKVLAKARAEGHLTILAHPFRWQGAGQILDEGLLPDAIEHRTCNQGFSKSARAEERAEQLHLPLVNAGDTHSVEMLGRFWIETTRPIVHADDIRDIILAGEYARRTAEDPVFYRPGFTHGLGRVL